MEMYIFVSCFIHKVTLGTNPICLAAPAKDGDDFVLDMATTSVALGKVNCSNYVFFFKYKILNVFKRKTIMILMFFLPDRVAGKKG